MTKKSLRQMMKQYGLDLDSDSDLVNTEPMSDDEINKELARYEPLEPNVPLNAADENIQAVQSPMGEREYVPKPIGNALDIRSDEYVPKPIVNALVALPRNNEPKSAVEIVNPIEHSDLRSRLEMKHEGRQERRAEKTVLYSTEGKNVPNREISCFICHGRRATFKYQLFNEMTVDDRVARVRDLNLCDICFSPMINEYNRSHQCRAGICRRCNAYYHNSKLCRLN